MKILLTNNTLAMFAGSETATYTMAVELIRRGHEVSAFSKHLGDVATKMKEKGVTILDNLDGRPHFDVAICNHYEPTLEVKAKCPGVPIIFTTHGIIDGPETPPLFCDHYVAVSEEVNMHILKKYGIASTIIRNAVDLDRYKPTKPRDPEIKNILLSSSYYSTHSDIFKKIFDACRVVNATVHCTGKDFKWLWSMEEVYNRVDLVITLGRGVLEAMACDRPAIVIGHWGKQSELSADGLVDAESFYQIRKNNFSSRHYRHEWDTKRIVEEINRVKKLGSETNYRGIVIVDHDIKNAVDKYLEIADKIISNRG